MHLQAEERHWIPMLKESIDQSTMRNGKRLERERQQNMREHAITAHSDLHRTPSMPIFTQGFLTEWIPASTLTIEDSEVLAKMPAVVHAGFVAIELSH